MKVDAPAALSLSRFLLGPGFLVAVLRNDVQWCAVAWLTACATDICDGWLARRRGSASESGARLDTLADFVFLILALAGLAARGMLPVTVPLVSVVMFAQFWLSRGPLVYDPVGKYYGVFLFGFVGAVAFVNDEAASQYAAIGFYLFTGASVASRVFSGAVWKREE